METKMNTELDLELMWLFEERSEDPCEHSGHSAEPRAHAGPGEWLLYSQHCDKQAGRHLLVCDKYMQMFVNDTLRIRCTGCGERSIRPEDVYTILGRKGVDF